MTMRLTITCDGCGAVLRAQQVIQVRTSGRHRDTLDACGLACEAVLRKRHGLAAERAP
jgi:hypothetical protein